MEESSKIHLNLKQSIATPINSSEVKKEKIIKVQESYEPEPYWKKRKFPTNLIFLTIKSVH